MTPTSHRLRAVKLLHTIVWAFFAGCIVAIPPVAWSGRFDVAFVLVGAVAIEVVVLAANAWRCPLTAVAARHTDDRRANFDIYLPEWLARNNQVVFGSLYALGVLATVMLWLGWLR